VLSRRAIVLGLFAATTLWATPALASDVPVAIQSDLVVKLASYDKNMRTRAGDSVRTLIVVKGGDAESERFGAQFAAGMARAERIAGLPHTETVLAYIDAKSLAMACRERRAAIVVIAAELGAEVEAIREALADSKILSVMPSAAAVRRGIVLGFELEDGKPKLFLNLTQALRQGVAMSADVMKLMRIFE